MLFGAADASLALPAIDGVPMVPKDCAKPHNHARIDTAAGERIPPVSTLVRIPIRSKLMVASS